MTYEPDEIAHVRLPLISLVLLVALPAALIPVLQFLSISLSGNVTTAVATAAFSLSFAAMPGSVVGGSIIGLLVSYVIGGRKTMFLAVLTIVVAVAAILAIASPLTFLWGRTALNLGAGALLVLPILVLGHYGSHRQIAAGMPGLILGPFILVALVGLLTRPETQDRIAALTDGLGGLSAIEPLGWLAIVLTTLLVLSLFRAMARARGGRPNALFSAALRADARQALGFVLTGPQIYTLLIAMALTGHAATTYLGDFARKSPLEGFGIESTIAATLCLGIGGFVIARIFGPRRRQHVLATTIIFLFLTTALMAAADFMFAPTATSPGIFVWPYTQEQLVLLVLTCAAMAMLGASFAMIWLAIVEVGIGVLATILLITVLIARIAAPTAVPLLPIPEMWLTTGLLGGALVLVTLGTMFGRRARGVAAPAPSADFSAQDFAELAAHEKHVEPGFDAEPELDAEPVGQPPEPVESPMPREAANKAVTPETPTETPALRREPVAPDSADALPAPRPEPGISDTPDEAPAAAKPAGRLPWRRKRGRNNPPTEPPMSATPPAPDPAPERPVRPRPAPEKSTAPRAPEPSARHEAVHETHIDWEKLGATVEQDDAFPQDTPTPENPSESRRERGTEPRNAPPEATNPDRKADGPAAPRGPDEPVFTRHDSTIFDFNKLRTNTRKPDTPSDPQDTDPEDKEKE